VRLCDVLFLCRARPLDVTQEVLCRQLAEGRLPSPDIWEVRRSTAVQNDRRYAKRLSMEARRQRILFTLTNDEYRELRHFAQERLA
jgi:hypothetical protein